MPTDTDLAWTAGIIEGEGSIRINRPGKRNLGHLVLAVTSTDADMLTPLNEWWPGFLKPVSTRPECKDAYSWVIAAKAAEICLLSIRPFCRVERILTKIDLGLQFQAQKMGGRGNRTDAYRDRQWEFYEQMKVLNRRGAPL